MDNRNKKNNKWNSEELGTESITNSKTSTQDNATDQTNKKIKSKKKLSDAKNDSSKDSCQGEPKEETITIKTLKLQNLEKKTKNKQKTRKVGEDIDTNNLEPPKVKKIKTNEGPEPSATQVKSKNKKIVFADGGGSQESLVNSIKNKNKFLNEDEAAVNEEDIDKFCDEITDEDNKTYENWVQLFEANFKKNKKTTT